MKGPIVGKVTAIPNWYDSSPFGEVDVQENAHMRDHLHSMMSSIQGVLRQINESEIATEVVITALGVYQETSVAVSDGDFS